MVMLFSTTVNAANDNNEVHDLTGTLTKIVHQIILLAIILIVIQILVTQINQTILIIQVFIIIQTIIYQKQVLKIQFQ